MDNKPTRKVINANSLEFLPIIKEKGVPIKAIITSLPDPEEIKKKVHEWINWLPYVLETLEDIIDPDGIIFFYQTGRRNKGEILDKSFYISKFMYELGFRLILKKIILRRRVGAVDIFRPGFTDLIGFSKNLKSGKAVPDVIEAGKMIYKNAMGFNAVNLCLDYIEKNVETNTIFDPFCGQGSVLKLANLRGFDSIGIDIDINQCKKAEIL